MAFVDLLRMTVLLAAAAATVLAAVTAIVVGTTGDTLTLFVALGWWIVALVGGLILGRPSQAAEAQRLDQAPWARMPSQQGCITVAAVYGRAAGEHHPSGRRCLSSIRGLELLDLGLPLREAVGRCWRYGLRPGCTGDEQGDEDRWEGVRQTHGGERGEPRGKADQAHKSTRGEPPGATTILQIGASPEHPLNHRASC